MPTLEHRVERSVVIEADRSTVFGFFQSSDLWATWWGAGSTVDPRPGGDVRIVHSNGAVSVGNVVEVVPPERFVFTFSLHTNPPTPPDQSRVTIVLEEHPRGTLVGLTHELADANVAGLMEQGWRFHLSLFLNAVANAVHKDAATLIDAWFGLWKEPDAAQRSATLARIATPGVVFRDRYSALEGVSEVEPHIGASQRFQPGVHFERRGEVRHCQGTAVAEWAELGGDGKERTMGTGVFLLDRGGKIASVTGIVNP
jgi:uncharacterized protein YndB with AHSA1/START domain